MSTKPSIHRLIELEQLLLQFRSVNRMSYIPGTNSRETDVEHSYFLAMMAWFLAPHFPKLDASKMIRLALAHDLVEVHSGDTFVYGDKKHLATKADREKQAIKKLHSEWSDFPDMTQNINDYAEKSSEEAKFVYALDKLLPPIINYLDNGRVWQENSVTIEMFKQEKQKKISKDSPIYPYYLEILDFFVKDKPQLFHA